MDEVVATQSLISYLKVRPPTNSHRLIKRGGDSDI